MTTTRSSRRAQLHPHGPGVAAQPSSPVPVSPEGDGGAVRADVPEIVPARRSRSAPPPGRPISTAKPSPWRGASDAYAWPRHSPSRDPSGRVHSPDEDVDGRQCGRDCQPHIVEPLSTLPANDPSRRSSPRRWRAPRRTGRSSTSSCRRRHDAALGPEQCRLGARVTRSRALPGRESVARGTRPAEGAPSRAQLGYEPPARRGTGRPRCAARSPDGSSTRAGARTRRSSRRSGGARLGAVVGRAAAGSTALRRASDRRQHVTARGSRRGQRHGDDRKPYDRADSAARDKHLTASSRSAPA